MADVFVSYKREDAARVRKLIAALRAASLDVWWDEDIPGGAQWEATIEQHLLAAKAVVVCWSMSAVVSENVRSEARLARNQNRLVQVFLQPCDPPLFFGERQGIDLNSWRGNADDTQIAKLVENLRRVGAKERLDASEQTPRKQRIDRRLIAIAAALLLVALAAVVWWRFVPTSDSGPTTLAVLPFRALEPADASLVDGIWDDTRGALGRNPNMRVIGRESMQAVAGQFLEPAAYRKKLGADYLLDGSVQHVGNQVQMKLSLVRTKDGAEVWNDRIGGKLDNVFAFQQRVASEVEGRIRGRVAPGGGVKAQNIATTGEVYSIFAEARAEFRKRNPVAAKTSIALLRKAVALDPNYAPAWALYGQIMGMGVARDPKLSAEQQGEMALQYVQRALQLAPNLAQAHATLGMIRGARPEAEAELRKAIALDPGNVEAWGWLGNNLKSQNKMSEALAAYTRAEEIEPLWGFTVGNRVLTLAELKDMKGLDEEFRRLKAAGESVGLAKAHGLAAGALGHPGEKIAIYLKLRKDFPDEAPWVDTRIPVEFFQLGYIEEGVRAWDMDALNVQLYHGDPIPAALIRAAFPKDIGEFWTDDDTPLVFGRILPPHGRLAEYIGYYRAAFPTTEDLFSNMGSGWLIKVTPTLVADLRAAGMDDEATSILQRVEPMLAPLMNNGPLLPPDQASLARYRALDGHADEAVALLRMAVAGGWLPDGRHEASDIAQEPYFASLLKRQDFQAVRQRIFVRIQEERRKVPQQLLAQAYPAHAPKQQAA